MLNEKKKKKENENKRKEKNANFEKDSCLSSVAMETLMVAHMRTPLWF